MATAPNTSVKPHFPVPEAASWTESSGPETHDRVAVCPGPGGVQHGAVSDPSTRGSSPVRGPPSSVLSPRGHPLPDECPLERRDTQLGPSHQRVGCVSLRPLCLVNGVPAVIAETVRRREVGVPSAAGPADTPCGCSWPASVLGSGRVQDPPTPCAGTSRRHLPSEKCTHRVPSVHFLVSSLPSGQRGRGRRARRSGSHADRGPGHCRRHTEGAARCVQENAGGLPGRWVPQERGRLARQRVTVYSREPWSSLVFCSVRSLPNPPTVKGSRWNSTLGGTLGACPWQPGPARMALRTEQLPLEPLPQSAHPRLPERRVRPPSGPGPRTQPRGLQAPAQGLLLLPSWPEGQGPRRAWVLGWAGQLPPAAHS